MKLDGLTVLDLSLFLPGPAATQHMADHGARVIKVENPRAPEPTRSAEAFPWQQGAETVMFRNTQRGKESIALDLKTEAGKTALLALAQQVDVVVEAFRPGVAKRLGIDYDTLSATNPGLIYCSISAFGQTGPWRDKPAHDTATVAAAGILDLTRSPEGDAGPAIIGVPIADMLSSYLALSGILMALHRRQTTGQGDFVDISMFESVLAASPNILRASVWRRPGPRAPQGAHSRRQRHAQRLRNRRSPTHCPGRRRAQVRGGPVQRAGSALNLSPPSRGPQGKAIGPPLSSSGAPFERAPGPSGKAGLRAGISAGAPS